MDKLALLDARETLETAQHHAGRMSGMTLATRASIHALVELGEALLGILEDMDDQEDEELLQEFVDRGGKNWSYVGPDSEPHLQAEGPEDIPPNG